MDMKIYSIIKAVGAAEHRLVELAQDDVFETTSKHNEWWDSLHEVESEKLESLRLKLKFIHDELWEIVTLLSKDDLGE